MSGKAPSAKDAPRSSDGRQRSALWAVLGHTVLALLLMFRRYPARQGRTARRPATAQTSNPSESPRDDAPNVATRPVLFTVIGFFIFVGLSLAALRAYYAWSVSEPTFTPPRSFAEPRLQSDPSADLGRLQAEQHQQLNGYAFVDRDQGLIRIPIDRAMDLIAGRGADAYAPLGPTAEPSPVRAPEKQP